MHLKVKCSLPNFKLYRLIHKCKVLVNYCTQESNYRLNHVYEKALRLISEDCIWSFSDLVPIFNEDFSLKGYKRFNH